MASHKLPSTPTLATAWCNRLNQYCEKLAKDCTNLHAIVQRKPQPGSSGDNFDTFLDDLNDDVSAALAELQHLEARTTDTLSFEELLVHCDALYQSNEDGIRKLELQLQQYGYTPVEAPKEVVKDPSHKEVETYSQSPLRSGAAPSSDNDYEASALTPTTLSYQTKTVPGLFQYSPLFGDLGDLDNLESLGISATSLTSLAGQDEPGEGSDSVHPLQHKLTFAESPPREDPMISSKWEVAEDENILKPKHDSHWNSQSEIDLSPYPSTQSVNFSSMYGNDKHLGPVAFDKPVCEYGIGTTNSAPLSTISKKDVSVQSLETKSVARLDEVTVAQYDSSPSWLKRQFSMEELNSVITKINELLRQRNLEGQHAHQFVLDQDDVQALGLGSKSKACFLFLQKADKLVTQVTNGVTAYRVQVRQPA